VLPSIGSSTQEAVGGPAWVFVFAGEVRTKSRFRSVRRWPSPDRPTRRGAYVPSRPAATPTESTKRGTKQNSKNRECSKDNHTTLVNIRRYYDPPLFVTPPVDPATTWPTFLCVRGR
jgi:hypothetical protein